MRDDALKQTRYNRRMTALSMRPVWNEPLVLYFGDWREIEDENAEGAPQGLGRWCDTQFHAFEFSFRGAAVRWIGTQGPDHGFADVYIDGERQATVDNYAETPARDVVKFEKLDIEGERIHTLRVVVRKQRHPEATGCRQDVTAIESICPVSYPAEIARAMHEDLARIRTGTHPYLAPPEWTAVPRGAEAPESGVDLGEGVMKTLMQRNIEHLNECFASPTYVDGVGWSKWLPASVEGRLLAGAGHTLRWGEREDMRAILDKIVADIDARMRDDGYFNYYPEQDSYALNYGNDSERKNYDRVFWTRGMIAAGRAGHPKAFALLRRMYDWFNASPYLPDMLFGGNATNGMPGGPLAYLSAAGVDQDLVTTLRYYDQHYWRRELADRQPLALSHYPGERPHCYDLLGFEMMVDAYRATGDRGYLDAVLGGWDVYRDNFKHIGGATAIMENHEVYPPKSYYFESKAMGETCGSVFWIYINSKLLQLFPSEERFAAEIEEAVYNVIAAAQDPNGRIRYHNRLHGRKADPRVAGTCCEVAAEGLIGRLPELIYSIADGAVYVNLFEPSVITLPNGARLAMHTDFPNGSEVSIRFGSPPRDKFDLRIRVPAWATGPVSFDVNGETVAKGTPGSYLSIVRTWADGDTLAFRIPMGFRTEQYEGLDQLPGNLDRYALLRGPILLALLGDPAEKGAAGPRLEVDAQDLPGLLAPVAGGAKAVAVHGMPDRRFVPYWTIDTECFTCFPAVQP